MSKKKKYEPPVKQKIDIKSFDMGAPDNSVVLSDSELKDIVLALCTNSDILRDRSRGLKVLESRSNDFFLLANKLDSVLAFRVNRVWETRYAK